MKLLNINTMSVNEKMELAYKSSDTVVLSQLAKDPNALIRRLVAKSKNISKKTINSLAKDPVLNVSFIASNNPKCDIKREFGNVDHPCVTCSKDERFLECLNCSLPGEFNSNN